MGLFDEQRKKYLFVILSVLGWSKLLILDLLSQKFPRLNIFARIFLCMLDRTLTTPNHINDKISVIKYIYEIISLTLLPHFYLYSLDIDVWT